MVQLLQYYMRLEQDVLTYTENEQSQPPAAPPNHFKAPLSLQTLAFFYTLAQHVHAIQIHAL